MINESVVKMNKDLAEKFKEQEEIINNLKSLNQRNSSNTPVKQFLSTVSNQNTANLNQLQDNSINIQQNPQANISNTQFERASSELACI